VTTPSVPEPVAAELAPRPVHRWRTRLFQLYLVVAMAGFLLLFGLATNLPYLPIDVVITLAVQRFGAPWFTLLMRVISWPGFAPQTFVVTGMLCLALFAAGLRWEAVCALVAAVGPAVVGTGIKFIIHRPRPDAGLVRVFEQLNSYSFPSGHVLFYTAFFGFLFYLFYILFKRSLWRAVVLTLLGLFIALVGVSRIDLGQHWFSDVLAAYLFGSLWLAVSVYVYQWGKDRYFVRPKG
jgi:membrane-associated phospholipid phosphatase